MKYLSIGILIKDKGQRTKDKGQRINAKVMRLYGYAVRWGTVKQ